MTRNEKNIDLCRRAQQGDKKAEEEIIKINAPLIMYFCKKFNGVDYQELFSYGQLGLLKAVRTFDENKNFKFVTYAARCIENEILMYLRRSKRQSNTISLDAEIVGGGGKDLEKATLMSMIADPKDLEEQITDSSVIASIKQIIKVKLNPMQARVINGLYFREINQRDLSVELGISQSYVSRIARKATEIIKKEYIRRESKSESVKRESMEKEKRPVASKTPDKTYPTVEIKKKVRANPVILKLLSTEQGKKHLKYIIRVSLNLKQAKVIVEKYFGDTVKTNKEVSRETGLPLIQVEQNCALATKIICDIALGKKKCKLPKEGFVIAETEGGDYAKLNVKIIRLMLTKESRIKVRKLAKNILQEKQQQIFSMRYLGKFPKSQEQVARETGMKLRNVQSYEFLAIKRIEEGLRILNERLAQGDKIDDIIADLKYSYCCLHKRKVVQSSNLFTNENLPYLTKIMPYVLTSREIRVIQSRHLSGVPKSFSELGAEFNVSGSTIYLDERHAIRVLNECLERGVKAEDLKKCDIKAVKNVKKGKIFANQYLADVINDETAVAKLKEIIPLALTQRQAAIIKARYFTQPPQTQIAVAAQLGVSSGTVSLDENKAIGIIKKALEEQE